jgi:hypothetical protein
MAAHNFNEVDEEEKVKQLAVATDNPQVDCYRIFSFPINGLNSFQKRFGIKSESGLINVCQVLHQYSGLIRFANPGSGSQQNTCVIKYLEVTDCCTSVYLFVPPIFPSEHVKENYNLEAL